MRTTPKVLNKHRIKTADLFGPEAVHVTRPGPWGNPYVVGRDGTREECIAKFRAMILSDPQYQAMVRKHLRGKDLVCVCAPLPCHADVLLEVANK